MPRLRVTTLRCHAIWTGFAGFIGIPIVSLAFQSIMSDKNNKFICGGEMDNVHLWLGEPWPKLACE